MEYITLNNGIQMPKVGFGVCGFQDLKQCEEIVLEAMHQGYRMFDTAAIYHNEQAIGNAIKHCSIPREELFITSKLWVTNNTYEGALQGFYDSLHQLQLDYIDLYLIHRPLGDYYGAYRALEHLYKEGRIKAIGLSNFFDDRLVDLCNNVEIQPMVNQVQSHPFLQRNDSLQLMEDNHVQMQAWAPFGSGLKDLFINDILVSLASKYNKTVGQIILKWNVQRGVIVIPRSSNPNRMHENIDLFDFTIDEEDMKKITSLDIEKVEDTKYRLESMKRVLNTK